MTKNFLLILLLLLHISTKNSIAEEVRLVNNGGTYSVPVFLNDAVRLNFVVDTGATDVTMPFDTFMTLLRANTIRESDIIGKRQYQMANGTTETFIVFKLKKMQIGNRYIYNVKASSSSHMKSSLLLGQSALRKLEPWRIDTRRGILYIDSSTNKRDQDINVGILGDSAFYIVQPGDTLYSISKAFDINLNELKRINNIGEDNIISIGQRLRLHSADFYSEEHLQSDTKLNQGFMMNQKYICINKGVYIKNKIVPIMSTKEALQNPIRFFIDSNNILQTDGTMKNLHYIGNRTYSDGSNKIKLFVTDNKRYMALASNKFKNIPIVHICEETDNWTIVK